MNREAQPNPLTEADIREQELLERCACLTAYFYSQLRTWEIPEALQEQAVGMWAQSWWEDKRR